MSRIIPILSLAGLLGLSLGVLHAQDPLQELRARQKAALEKLGGEVDKAIADSRKLSVSDAKTLLQLTLRQVKDTDMLAEQRAPLVKKLTVRIAQVDQVEAGVRVAQDQKPLSDPPRKKFEIPTQPGSGGGTTSGMAKDFIASAKGAQKTNADLIAARERGVLAVNSDPKVLPMDKEFNLPANWKELTVARENMVAQKLTKKEVALLKTLNSTMSVDFDPLEFDAVINYMHDKTGLDIIIDEGSMRDLNVDYKDKITFSVKKASVRTILKKVLGDKGLTYIIKEGAIQVMTPKKASEFTVVRSYPIGDLITPIQANRMMPPFMQQVQKQQAAQQVINLIVMMTNGDYWQPNGPGSISYVPGTDALLIRASTEMHYQLSSPGLFGR